MSEVLSVEKLAAIAKAIRDLPVDSQYKILTGYGFNLRDHTNWENHQSQPGVETIIPLHQKESSG